MPTTHVDWSAGQIALLPGSVAWPDHGAVRRAAVSAFGISGTNAHVIIEAGPDAATGTDGHDTVGTADRDREGDEGRDRVPLPWPLSARSEAALREQAVRLRAHLGAHPAARAAAVDGHARHGVRGGGRATGNGCGEGGLRLLGRQRERAA